MQRIGDAIVYSPSDLNHFLECEHLTQLDLARAPGTMRHARDAHADLLASKGLEHECAWLERFRAEGRHIVEIDAPSGDRNWAGDANRTLEAMRAGADVIYQGVLVEEEWHGISDFLVKTDVPSGLGSWSYEAWDTKLARRSRPYYVLQLCFYSARIGRLQQHDPARMHVILGTGEAEHFQFSDFSAYYRAVRRRFLAAIYRGQATYPYPVSHCGFCEYATACEEQWEADDHLSLVANIRREQVQRLNDAGIHTVAQLATVDPDVRIGIGRLALERLRHQAALQADHRRTGTHRYDLLPVDERTGFRLLPAPSPGDIFFDMEGDPYFAPESGLEYLFGATTDSGAPTFQAFQALDRQAEKVAFEQFVDLVHARLREWPDLHVYHYAAYEITALKRLMSEHSTREEELDDLLRREVFVDLYQVVRQSLRISHPSYSIKKVRTFFMEGAGQGVVSDGGDSILEFERWRSLRSPAIRRFSSDRQTITRKTVAPPSSCTSGSLSGSADARRRRDTEIPWKGALDPPKENPKREEEDAVTARRVEQS